MLLIRDPASVIGSWMGKSSDVHGGNVHHDEVGITQLLDVYSKVSGSGEEAIVIDSDDLAADPQSSLQELCDELGLEYRQSMMSWPAGPHDCDGPWCECGAPPLLLALLARLAVPRTNALGSGSRPSQHCART